MTVSHDFLVNFICCSITVLLYLLHELVEVLKVLVEMLRECLEELRED